MAQAYVDKYKLQKKNISTQTSDGIDFTFFLSNYKSVRLYKSKSYKGYVLSLNLGNSKKFIITKQMWKTFKIYFPHIDKILSNE